MDAEIRIKGELRFESPPQPFTNATMHVYLENVSQIDASAVLAGSYEKKLIRFPVQQSQGLPFEIAARHLDERGSYTIRAHIDMNGDGHISKGDFINMQSYPVATFGYPCNVSVLVKQVT